MFQSANVSRRGLAAAGDFEYRINADCHCPGSTGGAAACDIFGSGEYQVLLVPESLCSSWSVNNSFPQSTPTGSAVSSPVMTTPSTSDEERASNRDTGAIVGGVVGSLFTIILVASIVYLVCRKPPQVLVPEAAPQEPVDTTPPKQLEAPKVQQGPVFVSRPVPQPPIFLPSPRFSPPPMLPLDSAWLLNRSNVQALPPSFIAAPAAPLITQAPRAVRVVPRPSPPPFPPLTSAERAAPHLSSPPQKSPASPSASLSAPMQRPRYNVGVRVGPRPSKSGQVGAERDEDLNGPWGYRSGEDSGDEEARHSPQPKAGRMPYGV